METLAYKKTNTNWKARISVHPNDICKAWEIIFPFLAQKNISFKVVNLNVIEQFKNIRQEKLARLIAEYDAFLQNQHTQDIAVLKRTFYEKYQKLNSYKHSEWQWISFAQHYVDQLTNFIYQSNLSRSHLVTDIKNTYQSLIDLRKQKLKNSLRFYEGMQFTIYILPGLEKQCQKDLEEVEKQLAKAGIKPGVIFPNDRQIGMYSSIRHPGKWHYHKATDPNLQTYNPDNVDDPFDFMKTLPREKIIQEKEIQAILECRSSAATIISTLKTQKLIAPSHLKKLAVHKEGIVSHIKILAYEEKKGLVTDCLDKSTNLGRLFRVQRGFFSPRLRHGTLKKLEDIVLTMGVNNGFKQKF